MPPIHVVHDIPGRLRLRLPRPAHTDGLQDAIAARAGVTSCSWSPRTRSVLLCYEPEAATAAALLESVALHTGLDQPPGRGAATLRPTAPGVKELVEQLDRRVRQATGGAAGLGSLVPMALAVWAVSELIRGRTAPLAWSSALWYAHGLFRDYNLPPRE